MYLKRLEIQGFKSFAKKTTLEFEQGITAIVGPNGSGKSNVADSLRWVLGEQSAKLVRGKKSDDVIFAGSDKKIRAGFAEVAATFDNRDHKIPLDYSEVSIGRRIDRSGESEYLINGNRVRLLDVVDLVLKSNIGTSRYTVIGQGTIDNMILSGPGEIKNLIDEASGVKTYHIRRDRALRRLEQTAQNLMRAEDLISELEPRVKSLRRQAKRMEAREEVERELRGYQKQYLGSSYWRLKEASGELAAQESQLQSRRTGLEKSAQAHLDKIERHEQENVEQLESFQRLQSDLQSLQQKKNALLENLSLIRGKMQSQKTGGSQDAASLRVDQHTLTQRAADLRGQLAAATSQREQAEAGAKQARAALAELDRKLDGIYESLQQPAAGWATGLEEQLASLDQLVDNFYDTVRTADLETIRAGVENLRRHWQEFRQAAQNSAAGRGEDNAADRLRGQLKDLSQRKDALAAEYNNFTMVSSKAALSRDFLEQQLATAEQDLLQTNLDLKKADSSSGDDFIKQMMVEESRVQEDVSALQEKINGVEQSQKAFYEAENQWKVSLAEEDKNFRAVQQQVSALRDQEAAVQVEKAKYDTQLEALDAEMEQALGAEVAGEIRQQKRQEPTSAPAPELEDKIAKLKRQLELIGGVDELTLQEYRETEARYTNLSEQVADLKKSMDDLRSIMDELDQHIKVKFNEAFNKVNNQFENYFRVLFNGGRAYLSLIKSGDASAAAEIEGEENAEDERDEEAALRPEEKVLAKYEQGGLNVSGVDIRATPPGKKLSTIQALSGGERALTSIALLCSLLACFPSPFVVLDEVDAALDEANTIRFGQILGTLAHQTQFITITHNRETMAQSNMLYGVTMGDDGISKLLSIRLEQAKTYAK